jgi:L-alanine-DL-glutamate epimerase-like enolase superfamily enzyme
MKIVSIREKTVPLQSNIRNALMNFSEMTMSVVAIVTDVVRSGKPVIGYGFNSIGRYAQGGILRERIIPRLLNAAPETLIADNARNFDPEKAWPVMMTNEKPGGHGDRSVAVGTVDMALWDIAAKVEGKPLHLLLADRYRTGAANSKVAVYAAGGYYYPEQGVSALEDEIRSYLDEGYEIVKIKIGGASLEDDLRRIEAVLKLVDGGEALAVDANGRFNLAEAARYAEALAPYQLKWYEEPGDPLDFALNAEVSRISRTPLGTGENLLSMQESRNLIRYGGMLPERDFLQFDPTLGYGLVEYLRTLDMLEQHGWSRKRCFPHGGHLMTLHITAGLGLGSSEAYPGVFEPFGGFGDSVRIENGYAELPEIPGIGIESKPRLFSVFKDLTGD